MHIFVRYTSCSENMSKVCQQGQTLVRCVVDAGDSYWAGNTEQSQGHVHDIRWLPLFLETAVAHRARDGSIRKSPCR